MNDVFKSQGTRRFFAYCLAVSAFLGIGAIAVWAGAKPEVVDAVLWPLALYTAGYQGFGMLHDGAVRKAIVGTLAERPEEPKS